MDRNKIVRVGLGPEGDVYCNIKFSDSGNLSITGVIGPKSNGDSQGSCGQICMSDWEIQEYALGWDAVIADEFRSIWQRWHLNDMHAGSAAQRQYLQDNPIPESDYAYPKSYYSVVCEVLSNAGLNPDADGYKYGSAWLREEVPTEIINWLFDLPSTDKKPAWI